MNEILNNYFKKKEKEQKARLQMQRNDLLLSEGLYQKVYSEKDVYEYDPEYPNSELDPQTQKVKYYKKVPIEITDEEYERVIELSEPKNNKEQKNSVASVLTVIAWIVFIAGFIVGIVLGNVEVTRGTYFTYTDTEFSFTIALTYWAVSFVSGIFILGFAEIIKLLNDIKNK